MKDTLQTSLPRLHTPVSVTHTFNVKHIIESLPEGSTPAQQDSAVQAHLPKRPTMRSARPDTLNLPGWNIPSSETGLTAIPGLRDANYFSQSSAYHPEIKVKPFGMTAVSRPYLLRDDVWITAILLCCFLVVMSIFSVSKKYLRQYFQDFFFNHTEKDSLFSLENGREMRQAMFLYLQTGLLASLFFFNYTQTTQDLFMSRWSSHALLGAYILTNWIYIGVKQSAYIFVNWIFFDKGKRDRWIKAYSFLLSLEGILLFPLALTMVFFNLSIHDTAICLFILVGLIKVLLFYKTFNIFFSKIYGFLHLIVYFCALEILPLFGLLHALTYINDILL